MGYITAMRREKELNLWLNDKVFIGYHQPQSDWRIESDITCFPYFSSTVTAMHCNLSSTLSEVAGMCLLKLTFLRLHRKYLACHYRYIL